MIFTNKQKPTTMAARKLIPRTLRTFPQKNKFTSTNNTDWRQRNWKWCLINSSDGRDHAADYAYKLHSTPTAPILISSMLSTHLWNILGVMPRKSSHYYTEFHYMITSCLFPLLLLTSFITRHHFSSLPQSLLSSTG